MSLRWALLDGIDRTARPGPRGTGTDSLAGRSEDTVPVRPNGIDGSREVSMEGGDIENALRRTLKRTRSERGRTPFAPAMGDGDSVPG